MTERFLGRGDGGVDKEGLIADVGGKVCILHIEDNRDFSVLVATFLERAREDFVVETVNDPRKGLEHPINSSGEYPRISPTAGFPYRILLSSSIVSIPSAAFSTSV
jgi:hypothetical protein